VQHRAANGYRLEGEETGMRSWIHAIVGNRLGVSAFVLAALCVGSVTAANAQTDITYGGDARAFAMGGAGVALIQQQNGLRINPATLAFERGLYSFSFPTFALRSNNNISLGRASQFILQGQDLNVARDLALESFDGDGEIGANASASIRFSTFEIGGFAVGKGRVQPNQAFVNWATTARNEAPPADVRSDVFAAGYYSLPTISGAIKIPERPLDKEKSRYNYAVGARLKYMQAVYAHYIVDQQALLNNGSVLRAAEMGGRDTLTKRGVGMDVGFMMQPKTLGRGVSAALVIANIVRPGFTFQGTDRNDNRTEYDILRTSITAGAGFETRSTTLAADLVDITQSVGKLQLRLGAEQRLIPQVALRGGYSSATGFSYGVGLFGFDVAFGKNQPLEVVRTINF
jgi:hypothetical protein